MRSNHTHSQPTPLATNSLAAIIVCGSIALSVLYYLVIKAKKIYASKAQSEVTQSYLKYINQLSLIKENLSNEEFQIKIAFSIKDLILKPNKEDHEQLIMAILFNMNFPFLNTLQNQEFLSLNQLHLDACETTMNQWMNKKPYSHHKTVIIMLCYCLNVISHHNVTQLRKQLQNTKPRTHPINIPNPYMSTYPANYINFIQPDYNLEYQINFKKFLTLTQSKEKTYHHLINQAYIQLSKTEDIDYLSGFNQTYNSALESLKKDYRDHIGIDGRLIMVLGYCALTLKHQKIRKHREQLDRICNNHSDQKNSAVSILL
jgi:hypothetical protein